MNPIGVKYDIRVLTVKDIKDLRVKYASMLIRYKIYFTNRENHVFATAINIVYEMVKKGVNYDLCELLRVQLIEKL